MPTKQICTAEAFDNRRYCAVQRPPQAVTYVQVPGQTRHIQAACGHRIAERYVLTVSNYNPKPDAVEVFIEFTFWEEFWGRSKRKCLSCEQRDQLQTIIVCVCCGEFLFPGCTVVLGHHEHDVQLDYLNLATTLVESGDIVRCTKPECSANVQHHRGVWNGTTVEVPFSNRHHNRGHGRGGHEHGHGQPNP